MSNTLSFFPPSGLLPPFCHLFHPFHLLPRLTRTHKCGPKKQTVKLFLLVLSMHFARNFIFKQQQCLLSLPNFHFYIHSTPLSFTLRGYAFLCALSCGYNFNGWIRCWGFVSFSFCALLCFLEMEIACLLSTLPLPFLVHSPVVPSSLLLRLWH